MKKIIYIIAILSIVLVSCKKDAYEQFEGTYDIKSTGTVSLLTQGIDFEDEPGLVIIKKGDNEDEIFMYVETNLVTSIAPLGVWASAKVDGNKYDLESRNISITIDLDGQPLPLQFNVDATGELSDDGKTLTSIVKFSGILEGTIKCVGTKK